MIQLRSRLQKIDELKRQYRILLNRSRYRQQIENHVWTMAAELTSRFDLAPDDSDSLIKQQNKEGLLTAFDSVRHAPEKTLSVPFVVDTHAQALSVVSPEYTGHFRNLRAHWLNSTMVLANPVKVPFLMNQLIDGINAKRVPAFYWEECPDKQFQSCSRHPVMQAIETNYNLVAIHPFTDGNKRIARLITAWVLAKYGHIPLALYDRENYISGIENYFNTRHPHTFYKMMLDQMRLTYEKAITEANIINSIRVFQPRTLKKGKGPFNVKRFLQKQDQKQ